MNAATVLSRLKKAGVHIAAEDGQLKLDGPKTALCDEVLSELRQLKPELMKLLKQPAITKWRAAIEQVEPAGPEWQRLKDTSLDFLASYDAVVAIENGWNAVDLFGVHRGSAPKERVDCWGLILFVALGVHGCTIETISEKVCALRTRAGAVQTQPPRANRNEATPWWQHPAAKVQP